VRPFEVVKRTEGFLLDARSNLSELAEKKAVDEDNPRVEGYLFHKNSARARYARSRLRQVGLKGRECLVDGIGAASMGLYERQHRYDDRSRRPRLEIRDGASGVRAAVTAEVPGVELAHEPCLHCLRPGDMQIAAPLAPHRWVGDRSAAKGDRKLFRCCTDASAEIVPRRFAGSNERRWLAVHPSG